MAKNGILSNKFFVKLIYLISRIFLAWTSLIFLAHCELPGNQNVKAWSNISLEIGWRNRFNWALRGGGNLSWPVIWSKADPALDPDGHISALKVMISRKILKKFSQKIKSIYFPIFVLISRKILYIFLKKKIEIHTIFSPIAIFALISRKILIEFSAGGYPIIEIS